MGGEPDYAAVRMTEPKDWIGAIIAGSVVAGVFVLLIYFALFQEARCKEFGERIGAARTMTPRDLGCVAVMPDGTFRLPPRPDPGGGAR